MLIDGVHAPEIPLLEVSGSVNDPPEQIGDTWVNAGFELEVTAITTVLLVALNGDAQAALLVITQITLFAFARVVLV